MAGVEKTLEVFSDLTVLAVAGVGIAKEFKNGVGIGAVLGSVGKIVKLGQSVEELIKDLPAAMPELMELDSKECALIGGAAYDLVKKILEAVKK